MGVSVSQHTLSYSPSHALTTSSLSLLPSPLFSRCSFPAAPSFFSWAQYSVACRSRTARPCLPISSHPLWQQLPPALTVLPSASSPPQPASPATPCLPSVLSAPPNTTCSVCRMLLLLTQTQSPQHSAPS